MLAQSHARIHNERAMRRRKLKWLWARLKRIAATTRKVQAMSLPSGHCKVGSGHWTPWRIACSFWGSAG
jgi:hypothetical protein